MTAISEHKTRVLVIGPQPTVDGVAYDYDELRRFGVELHQPSRSSRGIVRKLRDVIEHRSGILWEDALRGAARSPDLVLALLEPNARAALIMRRLCVPPYRRTPIVLLSCWLAEELRTASRDQRRRLLQRYGSADLILCLSGNQVEIFENCGFDTSRIAAIPYGVAPAELPVPTDAERDIPLLSVGVDRGRDYETLMEAMRGIATSIDIYAQTGRVEHFRPPPSVRLHAPVPYREYRALLRRAKIVIVPTFQLAYPTGQSVALQAAMEGACVIVTRTPAMSEYFIPGKTALMPAVGNPDELRSTIERALDEKVLRNRIANAGHGDAYQRFRSAVMWRAAWREMDGRL